MESIQRLPAVAGQFYTDNPTQLRQQILSFLPQSVKPTALAVISPHAGYMYSGRVAGYSFKALAEADTYILLGPVHQMAKAHFGMSLKDWSTPLGTARIDAGLAKTLEQKTQIVCDETAHLREHSLEVQLPFLQVTNPKMKFVPVAVHPTSTFKEDAAELGSAIGGIIKSSKKSIGIVTSSDFSHFIPEGEAKEVDLGAIDLITRLDADGFLDYVESNNASICGYAPITVMLHALKTIGIKKGELLKYDTSASVTHDTSNVVGYASVKFDKRKNGPV
ncbi:MAG: AmmeMemoRadiSam system protein B [archaeon]